MLCVVIVVAVVLADTSFCHKENDIIGVLDKTFSVTEDCFGEHVIVGLRPGAAAQDVTEANKKDVDFVVAHRIAEQSRARLEGLGDVLPLDLLHMFDEHELELLGGGMTEIDMDDWTRFTDYLGFKKMDQVIEWFWACPRMWPAEHKLRLLQFTTGTSHVPFRAATARAAPRPRKAA